LHLARLPDAPNLVLVDGLGYRSLQELQQHNQGALPVSRFAGGRPLPLLSSLGGPWQKRYVRRLPWIADHYVLNPLWDRVRATPAAARWLLPNRRAGRLDVCHWSEDAFLLVPGTAHVVTVHDTIVLRHPRWQSRVNAKHRARKLRLAARFATRIIADSESTRRDTIELLGVAPERIDVIPLAAGPAYQPPADHAAQRAVLARYGVREQDYILYVGAIEPRKNVVRLATAFKAAVERSPELTTRLVLAGGRGGLAGAIDRGLEALDLGGRLLMPGRVPQEDLPALLNGARAVAYVSLYEGFGLPPLEAMACGAPVVASNTSSIPEVVGDAGLLVDPYSVDEIATALHRVLTDDALRDDLAARGPRRARRFSWTRTAELTLDTYRRAIATQRRHDSGTHLPRGEAIE